MGKENKKIVERKKRRTESKTLTHNLTGATEVEPTISFKYLCKMTYCFNAVFKYHNKNRAENIIDGLQAFIYEFSQCKNIQNAIDEYKPKDGPKINYRKNSFVASVMKQFKNNYNESTSFVLDSLYHLHLKRNGKGKFVLFGFLHENMFYVLAFDPEHQFDK